MQGEETQSEDTVKMSQQNKEGNSPFWQGIRTSFYCDKPDHIAQFCDKAKNKEREDAKNTKDDDGFAFATQYKVYLGSICE